MKSERREENNREKKKNVVQEEDRFETLVRIFSDGKDIIYISIIFVHRDNGYPYPPDLTEG